ncbi:Oxidoreductase [uncultured Defluviicoccus sp.]|uniref:Oxidoreductase n=1 Tax=metagenome TaxID=256318 RepID=A0A380TAG2_9ZZZZ|nr:Oxidoreductase [uncultured Defluviicoccus sp.]
MIGIGLLGFGYWGPNLARCICEAEGCRLAGIADPDADSLARAGRRYPMAKLATDWRSVVTDSDVDAVIVATPVRTHHELAAAVLAAGKHVLVEKPMTATVEQSEALIDAAARSGLILMVDHTFVYTPAVQKIGEIVRSGDLGQVYYYDSVRVNLGLFQSDVNVVWDLAVHDLAILRFILDDHPVAVSATGSSHVPGSPENMAHVTLYYGNGTNAHLSVNWLAPVKVRQTLVGGSRKMIIYDDLEPSEKIKVYDRGIRVNGSAEEIRDARVSYRMGDMWAPCLGTKEALLTEIEHFVACISEGTAPLTDGQMGLGVVETLEAAGRSMRRRGQPVELQRLRRAS